MSGVVGPPVARGSETSVAQWLELFFDLVVVAAVAVITDGLLEDQTVGGFGLAALGYVAVWLSWVAVVLYANVAEGAVHTRTVVTSMFLVGLLFAGLWAWLVWIGRKVDRDRRRWAAELAAGGRGGP